jgi:hypothetical protein
LPKYEWNVVIKQHVCIIKYERGECYIGKISRSLEVCIKEHKYNLAQGLLEKSKLDLHAEETMLGLCLVVPSRCVFRSQMEGWPSAMDGSSEYIEHGAKTLSL